MEKVTMNLIYELKENPNEDFSFDDIVVNYYNKYTKTDKKYYNKEILTKIAVQCFQDYARTANNPSFLMYQFFCDCRLYSVNGDINNMKFEDRIRESIWNTLSMTQVKNGNEYINGFCEKEARVKF